MMYDREDLFTEARKLARDTDWWTSHVAAKQIQAALPALQAEVLECIRVAGARGVIGSDLPAGRWKRLSELEAQGLIRRNGETRPGPSGRPQAVWVATEG